MISSLVRGAKEFVIHWASVAAVGYPVWCGARVICEEGLRYGFQDYVRDPFVNREVAKLYDRVLKKESSSGSLLEPTDREKLAALLGEVHPKSGISLSFRQIAKELEYALLF